MISRFPCLVTAEKLAEELNLESSEAVWLAMKAGVFPYYKFTKRIVRFDLEEVRTVLQAKMHQYELAKGEGPPQKNEAAAATTAQDYDAQKEVYKIGAGKSMKNFPILSIGCLPSLSQ
ncbi:MAG TPA: hypothetical protein DIU00_18605 [Phycisphaerales bacterium]|nr:hypothetical protein [Phycisphaerales bacterium]